MNFKPFGTCYWVGATCRLDYYVLLSNGVKVRQRPKFARARNGSANEQKRIEHEARLHLNSIETRLRSGELFDILIYPEYKQIAHFYWAKVCSQKEYIKISARDYSSEWTKVRFSIDFFKDTPANKIQRSDVKRFRKYLRKCKSRQNKSWSNSYVNRIISKVGQVYKAVIEQEIWEFCKASPYEQRTYGNIDICVNLTNPIHGLPKLEESPAEPVIPTFDQFISLLNALPFMHKMMTLFSAHTGLRKRNIFKLKKSQIDTENWNILIFDHKGKPKLILAMHDDLISVYKILINLNADSEYLFPKENGEPYDDIRYIWNAKCDDVGVPGFLFKNVRTWFTTQLISAGVGMGLMQHILGHTTSTMTSKHYNKAYHASRIVIDSGVQKPILKLINCDQICDQSVSKTG